LKHTRRAPLSFCDRRGLAAVRYEAVHGYACFQGKMVRI
jgi:hypothetical protein